MTAPAAGAATRPARVGSSAPVTPRTTYTARENPALDPVVDQAAASPRLETATRAWRSVQRHGLSARGRLDWGSPVSGRPAFRDALLAAADSGGGITREEAEEFLGTDISDAFWAAFTGDRNVVTLEQFVQCMEQAELVFKITEDTFVEVADSSASDLLRVNHEHLGDALRDVLSSVGYNAETGEVARPWARQGDYEFHYRRALETLLLQQPPEVSGNREAADRFVRDNRDRIQNYAALGLMGALQRSAKEAGTPLEDVNFGDATVAHRFAQTFFTDYLDPEGSSQTLPTSDAWEHFVDFSDQIAEFRGYRSGAFLEILSEFDKVADRADWPVLDRAQGLLQDIQRSGTDTRRRDALESRIRETLQRVIDSKLPVGGPSEEHTDARPYHPGSLVSSVG